MVAPGDDMLGDVGTSVCTLGGIAGRVLIFFGKGAIFLGVGGPKESTIELLELGNWKMLWYGMTRGGPRGLTQRLRSQYPWPELDAQFKTTGTGYARTVDR